MSASDVAAAIVHRSFFLRESKEEEKQARPEAGVTAGGDSMPAGQGSGGGRMRLRLRTVKRDQMLLR